MPLRNREAEDFVGRESRHAVLDFPTAEELFAALETRLAVAACSSFAVAARREAAPSPRGAEPELVVEPEFMRDFAAFLLARLQQRTSEMRQAQCQLSDELARLCLRR